MDHYRRSMRNTFVVDALNRAAEKRRDDDWVRRLMDDDRTRFMPIWRSRCLITPERPNVAVELSKNDAAWLLQRSGHVVFLGIYGDDSARFAINVLSGGEVEDEDIEHEVREFGEFQDLRIASRTLEQQPAAILAYAKAVVDWQNKHRYCGLCGHPTRTVAAGHVLQCSNPDCAQQHFPRMDPAVIVSVIGERGILLGRQPVWPAGQYSVVAGFVEAGESLEQAVKREVLEETGILLDDVHYHSSQPWPFPSSIMLGFVAHAATDVIAANDDELEDARWFSREAITAALSEQALRLPSFVSISFRLIEDWFDEGTPGTLRALIERTGGQRWRHPK